MLGGRGRGVEGWEEWEEWMDGGSRRVGMDEGFDIDGCLALLTGMLCNM